MSRFQNSSNPERHAHFATARQNRYAKFAKCSRHAPRAVTGQQKEPPFVHEMNCDRTNIAKSGASAHGVCLLH